MTSPAKRHFQKMRAAQESTAAADSKTRPDASLYELMMAQLYEHRMQLKNIQSVETKAKKKAEILAEYTPYLEGVLAADSGIEDEVLMYALIWHIDAGLYDKALPLITYALKHDLTPPDKFQRTLACIVAEDIAEAALKHEMDFAILKQVSFMVGGKDMPDPVKAKLHKAIGLHPQLQEEEPKTALNHLQTADSLKDKMGVKTAIKALQKTIAEAEKEQKSPE